MAIDYYERIPNNVDLADNRALQRALEQWQPRFLDWWREMGPSAFRGADVYLRTATAVDDEGWANYGYVRMPDYRWGIFLADPVAGQAHRLRRRDRRAGVAAGAGRASLDPAPADRHPGRHRAGLGRAAAPARA